MITADDWYQEIRLDGTNEYRKLKSRMIVDQECWCAGEGDRKGAGKTECPHTDFFDREIAKCKTDRDNEKLIMGWFIFDHETPRWLAVPPVASATTPSTATAHTVVSPPTNTRLSQKEYGLARLNNDASKFCDPETGLPLEAGFIRCRACNYVATQKLRRTRKEQKGNFFYDAVEWFQDQLQIPFEFDRPTPVTNYINSINREAPLRIEIEFAMHDDNDNDDDGNDDADDADSNEEADMEWFPATLKAYNFRTCMFDDNDLTCYALHQIEYDNDHKKYHDVIFIDHENIQIRLLGSLEWNCHHYRIANENEDEDEVGG